MARVLVTGSSDGLGLLTGRLLVEQGHEVVLHARNAERAAETEKALPDGSAVLVADLASLSEVRAMAEEANRSGPFNAVIHNAGVGYRRPRREVSADGHEMHLAVNVLAPYLLTALMERPGRLVYLSSDMHQSGSPSLDDLEWEDRRWNGTQAYCDTKLLDVVLAFAVATRWPGVPSNAVHPGWVATKMGGAGAPDDARQGVETQVWLATSDDPEALTSAGYWHHGRRRPPHQAAADTSLQDQLVELCAGLTGVRLV